MDDNTTYCVIDGQKECERWVAEEKASCNSNSNPRPSNNNAVAIKFYSSTFLLIQCISLNSVINIFLSFRPYSLTISVFSYIAVILLIEVCVIDNIGF